MRYKKFPGTTYNRHIAKRSRQLTLPVELLIVFGILVVVWAIGAVFYHVVEGLSYVDALYFTAITLTTVGYGDFAPQTDAGKIFTALYAFVGIGIFLGFAAALLQAISGRIRR